MDVIKHPGRGYEALVALPLALVTVFCFGFVMMHPYAKPQAATASEVPSSTTHVSSTAQSTNIINISNPLSDLSTVSQPAGSAISSNAASGLTGATIPSSSATGLTDSSATIAKQSSSASATSLQPTTDNQVNTIIKKSVQSTAQTLDKLGL